MARSRRSVWATIVLGAATLTPPASGDTFPGTSTSTGTDGAVVTGCWNDTGGTPAELTAHMTYLTGTIGPATGLGFAMETCDGTTDMLFDDNLNDGNLGLRVCTIVGGDFAFTASTADIECEQSTVQISPSQIVTSCSGMTASAVRRANWCHESGHALGLGHETACMAQGCFTTNTYSNHHVNDHLVVY